MKVKPLKGDTNLLVIFSFALSKLSACEGKVKKGGEWKRGKHQSEGDLPSDWTRLSLTNH